MMYTGLDPCDALGLTRSHYKEIAALERFDVWNGRKNFKRFHIEQAMGFCKHLETASSPATGKALSKSTINGVLSALRAFILWLSQREGYKKRIRPNDAEYFNISRRDAAELKAATTKRAPSAEQARHALSLMPAGTDIEKRDREVMALLCLAAVRVTALSTLRLKHIDLEEMCVIQDPREVMTKFGNQTTSFFLSGFEEAEDILRDWLEHQRSVLLRDDDDPLFPKTEIRVGETGEFEAVGLTREFWKTASPIREIVRAAFERAKLPNYGPHAFRHMHIRDAEKKVTTIEEFRAYSQNLGHASLLTTIASYGGTISKKRQKELIRGDSEV